MRTKDKLILLPFKEVAGIKFGVNIQNYLDIYDFQFTPSKKDDIPNWDEYDVDQYSMEVYTEKNLIVSICLRKSLFYRDEDLFNLDLEGLIKILDSQPDDSDKLYVGDEDEPHEIFDFDNFGIQVWMKDGIVDAIFCSN